MRARRYWAGVAVAAVVVGAAAYGGTALASHQFSDVPNGGFHDQITAIRTAGCATGFADGTFRPSGNTTRGQFAYWLNNCGGRMARGVRTVGLTVSTTATTVTVATATLRGGGAAGSGGGGFVVVNYNLDGATASGSACPCAMGGQVRDASTNATAGNALGAVSSATDLFGGGFGSVSGTAVFTIGANEQKSFQLRGVFYDTAATIDFTGSITAVYVPFGSQGGAAF